jgi:hypothetical protein
MNGKRSSTQQAGPAPKRGPISEFDDLIEEDLAGDDAEAAFLPDDLDEADPELGEAGRNWTRPPVPAMDAAKDSLGKLSSMEASLLHGSSSMKGLQHACCCM